PFGDCFLVDPVALSEGSQALLTILYCSTDRLRRGGAPVQNLSHSASFHSCDKNAPSKSGIKQLAWPERIAIRAFWPCDLPLETSGACAHRNQLLRCRRVQRHGRIEIGLLGAHSYGNRQ